MPIRALIVDDEPLARLRIRELLAGETDVEIVGEAEDGDSAVMAVQASRPDLLFLDIQMPGLSGLEALEEIGFGQVPAVIFVTAFDRFALRAFDAHALDYLLKPFDDQRFTVALDRARDQLRHRAAGDLERRLRHLIDEVRGPGAPVRRLLVPAGGLSSRSAFVDVDTIDWLQADGKYVNIYVGGRSRLLRDSLTRLEEVLDPERFVRIHRSTIVNVQRIAELEPYSRGEYMIYLRDGTRLKSGRSYRDRLLALMGRSG